MIHFDQASSAFPKAPPVAQAVADFLSRDASNIGRGSLNSSGQAARLVLDTRKKLACKFGGDFRQLVFTSNVTCSLNLLIKGFFKAGDHVLISGLEHNAVMRPLEQMKTRGLHYTVVPCDRDGQLQAEDFEKAILPETKAILCTAASNVCGSILPIREIGAVAARHSLEFFLDSAQAAGVLPIDMQADHITALALTGHKGLLGPQGIGALILAKGLEEKIEPLLAGGTGSASDQFDMPLYMPDRFEAGTLNLPGIAGLNAALDWLEANGEAVAAHEQMLCRSFIEQIRGLPLRLVGPQEGNESRIAVVSIDCPRADNAEIAFALEQKYDIATRVGLHCAPLAHQHLGTFPQGSVRFSFGYRNNLSEVETAARALHELLRD